MAFPKGKITLTDDGQRLYPHIKGIGRYFGISDDTFQKWTRKLGFPTKTADGWNIEEILAWRQANPRWQKQSAQVSESDGRLQEVRRLELVVLREDARKKKLQADALDGRFIDRVLVDRVLTSYVNMVKTSISEWCESLPSQMDGMSIAEMRTLLNASYDQLCRNMFDVAFVTPASDDEVTALKNERKVRAGKAKGGQRGRKKK